MGSSCWVYYYYSSYCIGNLFAAYKISICRERMFDGLYLASNCGAYIFQIEGKIKRAE